MQFSNDVNRRSFLIGCAAFAAAVSSRRANAVESGTLRTTLNANLNRLDPNRAGTAEEYIYVNLVFNGLTKIDLERTVQPDLATSWSHSDDLKSWTFKLRPGVKFHHGKTLDAGDVVATFKRLLDPAQSFPSRSQFEMISNVEAIDDLTVKFELSGAYAGLPDLLVERQAKIIAADREMDLNEQPMGTGPFKFDQYIPGERLLLSKHSSYFEAGLPRVDAVSLRIIPELAAQLAALKAGDIDLISNLALDSLESLAREPDFITDEATSSGWDAIVMNNQLKPFDDVRVRRAVLLAIDKPAMVQFALSGHGAPTHSPIPNDSAFFNNRLSFKVDIAQARELMKQAGHENGFSMQLIVPAGRASMERMAVAAQQMLKQIGITIQIQRIQWNRYTAEVIGKAPLYVDSYAPRPSADASTFSWFHSTGTWNAKMWNYRNREMDQVLEQARLSSSEEEQRVYYMRMQEILVEDPPGVIVYNYNFANAARNTVKNFKTHPFGWLDLRMVTLKD